MTESRSMLAWRVLSLALWLSPALLAAPQPVSPGRVDTAVPVAELCPSFDFAAVEGNSGYQLAIYDLGSGGSADPALVMQVDLPAGASGWTPSADQCLEPNRHYAWAVRTLGERGAGEWSEIATFRTPENAFTSAQIENLRARVREELRVAAEASTSTAATSRPPLLQGTPSGDGSAPDLATVKSGLRSMPSETTGEVAGVVGVSQSPDGAGMIAANTNPGGADLVLEGQSHGAADTVVTESGIDVGGETFSISGQPGLTVLIDGSEAVTSETIAEHDTLGMLDCATNQVAQWNGTEWVCKTLMLGDIEIPAPEAPQYLRVVPNYLDPSTKRLAWSMDDLTGVANFIVYQSPSPITEANKHLATRRVTSETWVPINVIPDSGLMHFRVEAVNIQGEAGELSREYRLNTALRLQFTVDDENGVETTYLSTPSGQLIEIEGIRHWSPGGSRYAFKQADGTYVTSEGGATVKVSDWTADAILWSPDDYHLVLSDFLESVVTDREASRSQDLDGFARWSPTGEAVAFADPDPDYGLSVWWLDAAAPIAIDVQAFPESWRWSPDGTRFSYFKHKPTGRLDLWIADARDPVPVNLTSDLDGAAGVRWSPDSSRVAFGSFDVSTGKRSLHVAVPGTGERVTISPASEGNGVWPFAFASGIHPHPFPWSPDGGLIAYPSDHESPFQYQVYVSSPTGGDPARVSEEPNYAQAMVPLGMKWSDDGRVLAFEADLKWDETYELFVWSREEGTTERVHGSISKQEDIVSGFFGGPILSPDSRYLAYFFFREGTTFDLYSRSIDGGSPLKLNPEGTSPEAFSPTWVPQGWTPRPD